MKRRGTREIPRPSREVEMRVSSCGLQRNRASLCRKIIGTSSGRGEPRDGKPSLKRAPYQIRITLSTLFHEPRRWGEAKDVRTCLLGLR
jgi:hypothetical protein